MNKVKISKKAILICLALLILAIFPLFANSNYIISVGVFFCTFACLGSAWNIIGGYAAQISWCHAAFVAIGSYTSFILFNNYGISPWLGMLLGAFISAIVASIIGSISFKLRGPFFSLSTIGFAELVKVFLLYKKDLTKGANGLVITFKEDNFWHLTFSSDKMYYYILLVFLIITVCVVRIIEKSRLGYYLKAIRADEDAVQSLGINSNQVKLKAFVISSVIASIVGTIYAFFLSYIDPASVGGLDLSTKIGTMAIVGGLGTIGGPIIGSFFLVILSEVTNIFLGESGAGMLLYGIMMIIVFIFKPEGLIGIFRKKTLHRIKESIKGKRRESANGNTIEAK